MGIDTHFFFYFHYNLKKETLWGKIKTKIKTKIKIKIIIKIKRKE